MGITEEAGRVANTAVGALTGSPVAIAILLVNLVFLGFCWFILGEVAQASQDRNKTQMDLISRLVTDIRDCRGGLHPNLYTPTAYAPSPLR